MSMSTTMPGASSRSGAAATAWPWADAIPSGEPLMAPWRGIFATMGLMLGLAAMPGSAQQSEPLRIGILTDMSGVFSDISGPGAGLAIKMAVEDFGGTVLGRKVEVLSADHQ